MSQLCQESVLELAAVIYFLWTSENSVSLVHSGHLCSINTWHQQYSATVPTSWAFNEQSSQLQYYDINPTPRGCVIYVLLIQFNKSKARNIKHRNGSNYTV